jgi:hypothetical protein
VLVAGEEDPVDRSAGTFQTGPRLGPGEDHNVASWNSHHQVTRHRTLDVVPEVVDQQHA